VTDNWRNQLKSLSSCYTMVFIVQYCVSIVGSAWDGKILINKHGFLSMIIHSLNMVVKTWVLHTCSLPLMSFFKPYRSASSKVGCDTVTGKNKIWLYVGSVSFTLTFSTHCFCSLQGHCLYIMACLREPCTSAWNVKPKCLLFRETSWPCTPVNAYRK